MNQHIETIECPVCNHIQDAIVEHTEIFNTYIHECENCQYLITESEWNKIETT